MSRSKHELNQDCEQDEDQDIHAEPDEFDDGPPYDSEDDEADCESTGCGRYDDRSEFADPGGNSALRRATRRNPRNLPCPTCGAENVLTRADVNRHYQCDRCADADEGRF